MPEVPQWTNYLEAVADFSIGRALLNSTIVTTVTVLGQIIVCSLGAYAFSRLRIPGREGIFLLYLATMIIPHFVTIIPLYAMVWSAGLIDTYQALILPGLFSPFGTFWLRQFFNQIPISLDEATRMDGGNHWHIYWYVIMPLFRAGLGALGIFSFLGIWNTLLWPVLVINSKELFTLPLALAMAQGQFVTLIHIQMAGAVIASIPVIIVFLLLQKQFIESIALSGMKRSGARSSPIPMPTSCWWMKPSGACLMHWIGWD
ncbi:carbohydrate ABC transporter permease [Chloroflexi bacterium TSY]|nr:carbohydrate ABC transporter permease [Chloroflexi bacterium TSY]